MPRRRAAPPDPFDPLGAVDRICADEGVVWLGIKHYSPACALHTAALIRERRPVAVLVEGPDDANDLIPWIVHPDTQPPLTLLSSWVDRRNKLGNNGVLSPSEDVPARYRGWWPLVTYGPEYAAVCAGHEVGATVRFIDASLKAQLPAMHGLEHRASDRDLAESQYVAALARKGGFHSFDHAWSAQFEAGAHELATEDFRRRILTFAWCARHVGSGAISESTVLREAHMRHWVDAVRKQHPDGEIVVVVGAYHAVALPFMKGKRAPGKPDRDTRTLLCAHSHRALSRIGDPFPGWGRAVHEAAVGGQDHPRDAAALRLLVEAAAVAREAGAPVGTADAVGAVSVARHLAALRGAAEAGPEEVLDAATTAYVKGDLRTEGRAILRAVRRVLVGRLLGRVAAGAGRPPLMEDYYGAAKGHRLDLSGEHRIVRCDVHKQVAHRRKSAFLHACHVLQVPMFGELADTGAPYKGPDLAQGTRLELTTETWAIRWNEEVDDRLVELSDRGTTVADAASTVLREALEEAGDDVAEVARSVLHAAQARAVTVLPVALDRLEQVAARDGAFAHLVVALEQVALLQGYREALGTVGDARVGRAGAVLYERACLQLPSVRHVSDEVATEMVEGLQSLVRLAVSGPLADTQPLDRALLVSRLLDLVRTDDAQPLVRGAGFGILHALGAVPERILVTTTRSYLDGPIERVLKGGSFLEGVLRVQRSAFLGSVRLVSAVHDVLCRLDDESFQRILPDLRRAFAVFVPAELDAIGDRVATELLEIGGRRPAPVEPDSEDIALARDIDARVRALLEPWLTSAGS
ncbi:MAG: hypothetical protein KTR31_13630 [Myxococcales bacterium]|nr:hypothetical protein [Myxococcales bacterium]